MLNVYHVILSEKRELPCKIWLIVQIIAMSFLACLIGFGLFNDTNPSMSMQLVLIGFQLLIGIMFKVPVYKFIQEMKEETPAENYLNLTARENCLS
jgi:uncharacterized membrane protein